MTSITAFLESSASLIAAIGALLAGLAALVSAIGPRPLTFRRRQEGKLSSSPKLQRSAKATAILGVLLILSSVGLFAGRALSSGKNALNVELTTAAWDAYNKKDFPRAIANSDKCIREFRGAADREQAALERTKVPAPPKGKVSNEERLAILSRGLLNDVATCYFIKGRSAEELGRRDDAIGAYKAAAKYTYARCWDPKGWFFSPSEAAEDRLAMFK